MNYCINRAVSISSDPFDPVYEPAEVVVCVEASLQNLV